MIKPKKTGAVILRRTGVMPMSPWLKQGPLETYPEGVPSGGRRRSQTGRLPQNDGEGHHSKATR